MKQFVVRRRLERELQVGYLVYLKLYPYRQHSIRRMTNQKLSPKYFGPYPVEAKVGQVAYMLTLLTGFRIHPTIHVSQLKKHIGRVSHSPLLPLVGIDGEPLKVPINILERCMVKRGNQATTEILVQWAHTFPEDSTWENFSNFCTKFPEFDPWGQGSCLRKGYLIWNVLPPPTQQFTVF